MQKIENKQSAQEFLFEKFGNMQIYSTQLMEEKIQEIVNAIPPNLRNTYNDDDLIAAAEFFDTWYSAQGLGENNSSDSLTPSDTSQSSSPNADDLPKKQKKEKKSREMLMPDSTVYLNNDIMKEIFDDEASRKQVSARAYIEALIIRHPLSSTFLKGEKVVPSCDASKFKEYEAVLVNTEENRNNFRRIKEAMSQGTPMDLNVSETAHKLMGVVLKGVSEQELGISTAGGSASLTLSELSGFLTEKSAGTLSTENDASRVGVKLVDIIKPESKSKAKSQSANLGKVKMQFVNKMDAIKEGHFIVTTEPNGDEVITKSLGIAETFLIYDTSKPKVNNQYPVRKVRLKGKYSKYPSFVLKKDMDVKFWLADRNVIPKVPTDKDVQSQKERIMTLLALKIEGKLDTSGIVISKEFSSKLDLLEKAMKDQSAKNEAGMED